MNQNLFKLIQSGIPVREARFHQPINNVDNVPETQMSAKTDNKSRKANMWLTSSVLVLEQKGKYIMVPLSNVVFAHALEAPVEASPAIQMSQEAAKSE